jgi:tRNA(fMet)-specific endonuclease VapC
VILDTSFLIALDDGNEDAIALAREHETSGVPQRLPATTLSELYVSVGAGTQPNRNARKYEELIGNLPVVEIDANIARRAGTLFGIHLEHDEKPDIGYRDATIAATGLVYNEAVLTSDTDDFGAVDGLQVVTW